MRRTLVGAIALLLVTGCGGAPHTAGSVPEQASNAQTYSKAQIRSALKLQAKDDNGVSNVDTETGCTVSAFLTTSSAIDLYAGAGDPVATNPSRTAGVKYGGYQGTNPSACYTIFTARLRTLR